jgi:hypothetical protein
MTWFSSIGRSVVKQSLFAWIILAGLFLLPTWDDLTNRLPRGHHGRNVPDRLLALKVINSIFGRVTSPVTTLEVRVAQFPAQPLVAPALYGTAK